MISNVSALLQAIYDNPEEETPRLQYADAVEEMGDASSRWERDRARLIRLHFEHRQLLDEFCKCRGGVTCPPCQRVHTIEQEVSKVIAVHTPEWMRFRCPDCHGKGTVGLGTTCPTCGQSGALMAQRLVRDDGETWTQYRPYYWRLGFIDRVDASFFQIVSAVGEVAATESLLGVQLLAAQQTILQRQAGNFTGSRWGRQLLTLCPTITRLYPTDFKPKKGKIVNTECYVWDDDLPSEVFDALRDAYGTRVFESESRALDALAVTFARLIRKKVKEESRA